MGIAISDRVWQKPNQACGVCVTCSHGVWDAPGKGPWGAGGHRRGGERGISLSFREVVFQPLPWRLERPEGLEAREEHNRAMPGWLMLHLVPWLILSLIHTKETLKNNNVRSFP